MHHPSTRFFSRRARRTLLAFAFSVSTALGLAKPVKFDIAAQPVSSALQTFGRQAGVEVVYPAAELKKRQAPAVKGELEPLAVLEKLLEGSGYVVTQTSATSFRVAPPASDKEGSLDGAVRDESGKPIAGAKVSLIGSEMSATTDRRGRFRFEEMPAGVSELQITAAGFQNTKVTEVSVAAGYRRTLSPIVVPGKTEGVMQLETYTVSAKKTDGVVELDPYSVEGRREKPFSAGNMDIPRTINDAQPYYIFDSKMIDQSGATDVEDFLKQRLTMNTTALSNSQITVTNSGPSPLGNLSNVNLRGVGADKTLILVNGRRLANVSINLVAYQPDLNGIPLSAIDRIEVLPTSASGIYGGSAIGGVVNVILKRNYTGGEIRATYDNTWDTDSPRRNVSFSYGFALGGGKTHVMLGASWADAKPLLLQDRRDVFERNMAVIQGNAPNFFFTATTPFLGSLPNIAPSSAAVASLTLKGGTSLGSRNTFISAGTVPTATSADLNGMLLANAGRWNLELPRTSQAPTGLYRPFGVTPENKAFQASVRHQLLARVELLADFSFNENRTESIYNAFGGSVIVPVTAPNNPFTTAVRVRFPNEAGTPVLTESGGRRATLGALLQLPAGWTGALDYAWSENRYDYRHQNIDSLAQTADLATGALNPFADTLRYPLNLKKYLQTATSQGSTYLHDLSARASGPLPALPWGSPTLTVGLEHRITGTPERTSIHEFPISVLNSRSTKYFARESVTDSAYLETTVPLVKTGALAGVHALDMQLSGRGERYTVDTGSSAQYTYYNETPVFTFYEPPGGLGPVFSKESYTSTNYTVGLKYQPVKQLTFRVSRASAFLPPTPDQLSNIPLDALFQTAVNDPKTGQTDVFVFTRSGGNYGLKPQTSRSLNFGAIWEPQVRALQGLRLNAEYYKIEQFNAIASLGLQGVVDQEAAFPGRVIRDASGAITIVDDSLLNLFLRETEGWDLSVNYGFKTALGTFDLQATQSIILHLKNQYSESQPQYEAAGYHPGEEGAAKYKTNATLRWEWRRWSAGWTTRYFSAYKQYGAAGGPISTQFGSGANFSPATYLTPQGGDTICSQLYHDLFFGYVFGTSSRAENSPIKALRAKLLDGLTVQCGVRNLFNEAPPLDVYYANNYYLSPYGDTRLRSYWVSLKKQF